MEAGETATLARYPLYSTSYTVHRLSPLYHGDATFDEPTLNYYSSQFRDLLSGEVLRGVRVGLATDDDGLAKVGALRTVQWSILKTEEDWLAEQDETPVSEDLTVDTARGIKVDITYEKATYLAILMRDDEETGEQEPNGFSRFPLLLTRMPGPLRNTLMDFLSTTFDTRPSLMRFPSSFVIGALEQYISDLTTGEDGAISAEASNSLQRVLRDLLITASIMEPDSKAALKSIDISISKEDTWSMLRRGQKLEEIKPRPDGSSQPFMTSLQHYIKGHLALDLSHTEIAITKIACGAFVIGAEGRIKLFAPGEGDDVHAMATTILVSRMMSLANGRDTG